MRGLFDIVTESIMSNDSKVTHDLTGEEATARFHYQLFMDYVGDLLYKKAPYHNYLSYAGYITFLLKDQNTYIETVYNKVGKALEKYFKEIKRIQKDKKISWSHFNNYANRTYRLNVDGIEYDFIIRNIKDDRVIYIQSPKDKLFMLP